jgi:hypothetical protein
MAVLHGIGNTRVGNRSVLSRRESRNRIRELLHTGGSTKQDGKMADLPGGRENGAVTQEPFSLRRLDPLSRPSRKKRSPEVSGRDHAIRERL